MLQAVSFTVHETNLLNATEPNIPFDLLILVGQKSSLVARPATSTRVVTSRLIQGVTLHAG